MFPYPIPEWYAVSELCVYTEIKLRDLEKSRRTVTIECRVILDPRAFGFVEKLLSANNLKPSINQSIFICGWNTGIFKEKIYDNISGMEQDLLV